MRQEKNFEKFIKSQFRIILPDKFDLFYDKGVRVGNKEIKNFDIKCESKGYAACDGGFNPTHGFIQNFGDRASRNVLKLEKEEAKKFANGEDLEIDLGKKDKRIILKYKVFCIGLGYYKTDGKKIVNKIHEKKCREIVNEIKG